MNYGSLRIGRQERERAVVERDRAEELAKRMSKSLKSRASGSVPAEDAAEIPEHSTGTSKDVATDVGGQGLEMENGDKVRTVIIEEQAGRRRVRVG